MIISVNHAQHSCPILRMILCELHVCQYLAFSSVADGDFPIAPNPTPTANPSDVCLQTKTHTVQPESFPLIGSYMYIEGFSKDEALAKRCPSG